MQLRRQERIENLAFQQSLICSDTKVFQGGDHIRRCGEASVTVKVGALRTAEAIAETCTSD